MAGPGTALDPMILVGDLDYDWESYTSSRGPTPSMRYPIVNINITVFTNQETKHSEKQGRPMLHLGRLYS